MKRTLIFLFVTLLGIGSLAEAGKPVVLRLDTSSTVTGAARLGLNVSKSKRSYKLGSQVFGNDEMRVRVTKNVAGSPVYVAQEASHGGPALSLFRVLQAVEASHSAFASSVHVILDEHTRQHYGEAFLASMFGSLDVASLRFADKHGNQVEGSVPLDGAPPVKAVGDLEKSPVVVWGGASHPELAKSVAKKLKLRAEDLVQAADGSFSEKSLPSDPKGKHIVLVQTKRTGDPERFHQDLLDMLHAAWRAKQGGATEVTLLSPYLSYSRSDRKDTPGTTVGAALLPQLMKRAGINGVVFFSVHQAQEVGIFQALQMKVAHASGESILAERIGQKLVADGIDLTKTVSHVDGAGKEKRVLALVKVAAPDAGATKRAGVFAEYLKSVLKLPAGVEIEVVVAEKKRSADGLTTVTSFKDDVKDVTLIGVDDETATGGTIVDLAKAAKGLGAKSMLAAVSHLTGAAQKKINGSLVDKLFVLDTLPQHELAGKKDGQIEVVGIDEHLAKVVRGMRSGKNIDDLLFYEHR